MLGRLAFLALPHEVLTHGRSGVWSDVLEWSGTGRSCVHDDRVVHGTIGTKRVNNTCNRGILLANSHVDADHGVFRAPVFLLVDDGVDGHGGLAGLSVANDQFSLTATDGNHGVDGLDTGLQWFLHRLTCSDAGCDDIELHRAGAVDGTLAVQWRTERIDHSAEHGFADGDFKQSVRRSDRVTFTNSEVVAVDDGSDGVLFKVHGLAHDGAFAGLELEEFAGHDVGEAVDASDAVADFDHLSDLRDLKLACVLLDFLLDD